MASRGAAAGAAVPASYARLECRLGREAGERLGRKELAPLRIVATRQRELPGAGEPAA
jgi:hypothetical protein